jgi:hypothetical protein
LYPEPDRILPSDVAADAAVKADAVLIDRGADKEHRSTIAGELAASALWQDSMPVDLKAAWDLLKQRLIGADEDWEIWIRWYEDRLTGRPSLDGNFDISLATLPDSLWADGPAAVNAHLKALIAVDGSIEPIPAQGAGPHFALSPDLKIALAPPTEIDTDGNNLGRIRQLLPQVQQAAGDLAGHVSPNSQPEISRNLAQYREAIAGEPETIAWGTVFGLGVRLENAATAARREIANRLQEPLEDAAQEALDSVLTLHGPLILATAEGRELSEQADQFRLTREEQAALRDAARQVAEALKNSNLADVSAARLTEEAAETIGEGRHPERGAVFGLATIRNAATLIIPAGVIGGLHAGIDYLLGGGVAGLATGAAAAGFGGFAFAEVEQVRIATRALGADIVRLVEVARDQADLARAQAIARLQLLIPFRDFVTRNEKPLREIAENSIQMRWALRYIDFIVRNNSPKE